MTTYIYLGAFCVFSFAVSAFVYKWMKTFVAYAFVSATASAMFLQLIGFAIYGQIDEWGYIAFPVTWVIALVCATFYFLVKRDARRGHGQSQPKEPS